MPFAETQEAEASHLSTGTEPFSPAAFGRGVRAAVPIVLGYLPVSFSFGVMAAQAGMSPLEAGLMSLLVFAGSGQIIAVSLMLTQAAWISIVVTTFVVNLRHLLMSAAMSPYMRRWKKKLQALYAFEMTDETFALNISRFGALPGKVTRDEVLGINMTAHLAWISGGIFGTLFGDFIGDIKPYGLDYALAGMFIAILTPHLRIPRRLTAALMAGVLSVVLVLNGVEQWNVIIATLAATIIGVLLPFNDEGGGRAH